MKQAPNVKLSLRKLLTAMMAVGPLAILPSPVWAVLPTQASLSALNGSFTVTQTGATIATISSSDRAVIQWLGTNVGTVGEFNVAFGEVYNFQMPAGGAVLNRVGTGVGGIAAIAGQLDSNGKVFVLAPGGTINVASTATITATGGLVLSTIGEENGAFLATGDLLYSGTPAGTITIGSTAAPVSVGGNLTAVAGTVIHNSSSVTGDMILRSTGVGNPLNVVNIGGGTMLVGGNLTLQTNAANIVQNGVGGAIVVGNSTGSQVATFNTGGNNSVTAINAGNDFQNIAISAGTGAGGTVNISDSNIVRLNASTIGGDLIVSAAGAGDAVGAIGERDVAIATNGAVNVVGSATFNTTGNAGSTGFSSRVNIAHNSTVGGTLSGSISNNGSFTFNGVGNLTTGTINAANIANGGSRSAVTITTTGNLTVGGAITTLGNNSSVGANITLTGASINQVGGLIQAGRVLPSTRGGGVTMNATAGNITVGNVNSYNRVSLTAGMGSISQVAGTSIITGNGSVTNVFNAPMGTVILDNANNFAAGNTFQISNATTANLTNTNSMVLGTTNVTGNLNLVSTAGGIQLGTGDGTAGQAITVGNVLSANAAGANTITDGNYSPVTVLGGLTLTTGGGNIVLDAATVNGALSPSVRYGVVNANAGVGSVTVSETTALNLGNITASSLTASSAQGGIVDTGALAITGIASLVVGGNNTIMLDSGGHSINTLNVSGTGSANIMVAAPVTLGTGVNVLTGDLSVTSASAQNITLGATTVVGNVNLSSGGGIDLAGTINVSGNMTMGAAGTFTLTPALVTALGLSATVALGSVTGLSVANPAAVEFASAPVIAIAGDGAGATATATLTNGLISGFTVTAPGAGYTFATATATGGTNTSVSQSAGTLKVNGTTSLAGSGAVLLGGANDFSSVVLNASKGSVTVNDVNDLSISGSATGSVLARAGGTGSVVANTWNLTLGNLNVGGLDAIAGNGGGGNSGTITQMSRTSVHSEGLTKFTARNNNIVVNNAGNSFGRVEISVTNTDGSRTVNVSEDGTMRLGVLNSRGTSNLTSRTGSIIEDPDANTTVTNNGTLNASAPAGSILIGGTTTRNGAFTTSGNLTQANLTAPTGAAAVSSTSGQGNIRLGNTNVNSLTVTSGNNITQNGAIRVFGTASFTATNNITLDNTGNNFGRVSLTTTNATVGAFKDIVISESGTLNLGAVTMPAGTTGNFTATSVNGDIIDTGLAGLKPGGTTAVGGQGSGLVTLNAVNGNIILDDPTTDFPTMGGVVFAAKNVTLAPLGNTAVYLGAAGKTAVATGNLTVTTALATGNIFSNGALDVAGDASFQAASANITLAQSGNKFGALKFVGQQIAIVESDDTALITGSTALNSAQISSGGNISIVNRGGIVQFNGANTFLSATGNITLPKLLQTVGTLTVNAAGTKDLSALSKSADLSGKDPVNLGAGAYVPPGQ